MDNEVLNARYVIFVTAQDVERWENDEFVLVRSFPCMFSDEYHFAEVEPVAMLPDPLTAEDVLDCTNALAVHEEYTNGILTTPEFLETISEIYCWSGAGSCFLADMLTDIEKLTVIIKNLYTTHKERIELADIDYKLDKDDTPHPITDNADKLFSNDIHSILYKGANEEILWWGNYMEETGFFLVVLDVMMDEDEEDEDVPIKTIKPTSLTSGTNFNPNSSNPWDDYDDEDEAGHYMNAYYRARGYI